MVYDVKTGGRKRVEYCATVLEWYCNRVGDAGGRGNKRMIDSCKKSIKVKECLVKAKLVHL